MAAFWFTGFKSKKCGNKKQQQENILFVKGIKWLLIKSIFLHFG
jgi:hypothetical protein